MFHWLLIIATAALYGDAVITPAISVLSAYEGLGGHIGLRPPSSG